MSKVTADTLLQAYAMGLFPMARSRHDPHLHWIDPELRGILPLDGFHTSRSLARRIRQAPWTVTVNRDFAGVVRACADRDETWINDRIFALYADLHRRGQAQSLEVWEGEALVGGVYGVAIGAAFMGESMFSRRRDASKVALAWLVHRLTAGGFALFDTQFLTPHLASLGGVEIPRAEYHRRLAAALVRSAQFAPRDYSPSSSSVAASGSASGRSTSQRSTQTSYRG